MVENKNLVECCPYCKANIKKGGLSKHKQERHANLILDGSIKIAEVLSAKAVDKIIERSEKLIVKGDMESALFVLCQVLEAYPDNMEAGKNFALALKKLIDAKPDEGHRFLQRLLDASGSTKAVDTDE
ncbi:MAG: hypothetical protein ACOC5T_06605 [Elusimicrobiota bacterium]